jgi:hypothetical protein
MLEPSAPPAGSQFPESILSPHLTCDLEINYFAKPNENHSP